MKASKRTIIDCINCLKTKEYIEVKNEVNSRKI